MRAIVYTKFGRPEVLQLKEVEKPNPKANEVLFMVEALKHDELIHEALAIVGCRTPSALAHAAAVGPSYAR